MANWTNQDKNQGGGILPTYLLKEDGDFLLLEDGGKIVLTDGVVAITWTNQTKN